MNTDRTIDETAKRIVDQDIHLCLSSVVSTLASGYTAVDRGALADLTEQAYELTAPVLDYEEAAIQAGWEHASELPGNIYRDTTDGQTWAARDWAELCSEFDIEPYDREVFEHWAVSEWLAEKLLARGEKVDQDFANLNVWARTTTGQAIYMDSVIQEIARELNRVD